MTYDQALAYLKKGHTIMRRSWLGKSAIVDTPDTHIEWNPSADDKAAKDWQLVDTFQVAKPKT